ISMVGTEFTPQTSVRLRNMTGVTFAAASVQFVDSQNISATFDLTKVPLGTYNLQAADNGQSATAAGLFKVIAGIPGSLSITITPPAEVRVGAHISVTVHIINGGDTDVPAPFIEVQADYVATSQTQEQLLGGGGSTLPGVIPPHFNGDVGFSYDPEPHAA